MSASKKTKKPKTPKKKAMGKKALKEAVDKIPGLILEEKKKERKMETTQEETKSSINYQNEESTKKIWLWTGVIIFSLIIFIIWIMSISNVFDKLDFKNPPEKQLLEQSKEEVNAILDSVRKKEEKEEDKLNLENIKKKLNQMVLPILEELQNQATSTTSTENSSTSTINQ